MIDFVLHMDKHLQGIVQHYGALTYLLLFGVLFLETGLVVTPFLPGDSLLFGAGALAAANGSLNIWVLFAVFLAGAVVGDTVNFEIGKHLGPRLRFLKKENLERTEEFFRKYGGKTIIIARFVPVVRTLAPFVAGTGKMDYPRFIRYNIVGGLLWVGLLLGAGYFFGNLSFIRSHFGLVVIAIVVLSLIPAAWEWMAARRESKEKKGDQAQPDSRQEQKKGPMPNRSSVSHTRHV